MKDLPKVTFGIINCNRLHYLKSCVESLVYCTDDYPNKEIIIVDNASTETGTDDYLLEKEEQGIKVHKTKERDPNNEFASALNFITRESSGQYIASIQGDMQFVINGGWLDQYVKFYMEHENNVGCIMLDAQRTNRIKTQSKFSNKISEEYPFFLDSSRIPFCCSADVMYSRKSLEFMGPFLEKNEGHEAGTNSEDDMRQRILSKLSDNDFNIFCAMPMIPPAVAIYTDPRGTNARVRGNKRYGAYWPPKENFRYYKIREFNEIKRQIESRKLPLGIEEMAEPIGWNAPIDQAGNWMKNPIRIDNCSPSDYEIIDSVSEEYYENSTNEPSYIDEWLNDE